MPSTTDRAIARMREMVVTGELSPGERLPSEAELARMLGVSRNSLREAVAALELVRVLDVRRGDGTYVTSLAPEVLSEALAFVLDLHRDDSLLEIFEVRKVLEPYATGLAATRLDAEALARLEAELDAIDPSSPIDEIVAHDLAFHRLIAAGCGNSYLTGLLDAMAPPTVRARMWRGITQADASERTLSEHRAIFEAIRAGDAALAQSWASIHIAGIEAWLRQAAETNAAGRDPE